MTCWLCGLEATVLATDAKAPTCEDGPCQICIAVAEVDDEINQASKTAFIGTLVHRLPAELRKHIFELALPIHDEWGPSERTTIPYLASVCRGWRDIAWSTPSLWCAIHIVLGTPNSQIELVNDWILRARTLPLHITLCDNGVPEEELKAMIDTIGKSSNRWHSLSLDTSRKTNARALHLSDLRFDLLKSLQILGKIEGFSLNPSVSPERIDISGMTFGSLQISWNHLTSARVRGFDIADITQLFQHASQMTCCHIVYSRLTGTSPMPSIIHHRLTIFGLHRVTSSALLLDSLTLPSLQEFQTDSLIDLTVHLPPLVDRSSCPLTGLTLLKYFYLGDPPGLQPLPSVTHLSLECLDSDDPGQIKELLCYFPDLCYLTLELETFLFLWNTRTSPLLLDGGPYKILVVGQTPELNCMWNSKFGKRLKASNIKLREDGFEISSDVVVH